MHGIGADRVFEEREMIEQKDLEQAEDFRP